MPFPATSETCYVAPPTSVPTFPPPPSLSLAASSRPFTLLLECFFFLSQSAFRRLESLPARCRQYLDQTPTPAQASSPSSLFPSISPFPSQSCCHLMSPPDTACGQNFSLLYFRSVAIGFAAGGALGGTGDRDAEGRAGSGRGGRWAAGRAEPPLRQACWQEHPDTGGCDSRRSSLDSAYGFSALD